MGEKVKSYTDKFSKEDVERAYQTGGNYTAAGEILGICRGSVKTLCEKFGVMKLKNMYGKQVRGIERSTFLIDREGRIAREWRGVKVPGHAEAVLEAVREL